jgi:hypothetical protein
LVSPPVEQGKDDGFRHSAIQGPVASPHPQPKPSMQTKGLFSFQNFSKFFITSNL